MFGDPIPDLLSLRNEGVVELRPFDGRVLLAVRHRDFYRAAAVTALVVRGREVYHVNSAVAGACPFRTKQNLVAGHRLTHC